MAVEDDDPLAVVFIVGERDNDQGLTEQTPIGTGFMVSVASATVPGGFYAYVVTAAHVVQGERTTWVRFNRIDGGVFDGEVPQWHYHPTEDVAAAPMKLPPGYRVKFIDESTFTDRWEEPPRLGVPVYFIGLLSSIPAMADANVPIVRSGTLGRLNQANVPIALPGGGTRFITAHLIDCRSYAGFSGSPCFVQPQGFHLLPSPPGHNIIALWRTGLLGMVAAHMDAQEQLTATGDFLGTIHAPVNTGVGIVVPVGAIRQLLDDPEFAANRTRKDAANSGDGNAQVPGGPDQT